MQCRIVAEGVPEEHVAQRYDAVIIGGGHNGLVSAAYLARAGLKTWSSRSATCSAAPP